jgi:hypothetical protein
MRKSTSGKGFYGSTMQSTHGTLVNGFQIDDKSLNRAIRYRSV